MPDAGILEESWLHFPSSVLARDPDDARGVPAPRPCAIWGPFSLEASRRKLAFGWVRSLNGLNRLLQKPWIDPFLERQNLDDTRRLLGSRFHLVDKILDVLVEWFRANQHQAVALSFHRTVNCMAGSARSG